MFKKQFNNIYLSGTNFAKKVERGKNMKIYNINSRGFTLIELLIVVAIIGILAAIAIPQFSAYRAKTYNASAQSDLHNVRIGLETFYGEHQKYPF